MKGLVLAFSLAFAFMLLFGCAGQQAPPAEQPALPNASAANNTTNATAAPPEPEPEPFNPISLSYKFSDSGPQGQAMDFDYYFDENTTCNGRPALNGIVKVTDPRSQGSSYAKITVYLDTGEAVYSDYMGESDLAFDTATPKMVDFDFAFALQTITARGGKSFLSEEVWNATKPVLFKNIAAFGGVGDYSVIQTGTSTSAGLYCKNFTVATKTSSMDGQILMCLHRLSDVNLAFLASGGFPGNDTPSWQLAGMSRAKSGIAYYPQCLVPIVCPSVAKPLQEEYDNCSAQGNSLEAEKDSRNCVSAFKCLTREEQANKSISQNQRPGCSVDDALVQQVASCWNLQGNVNYQENQQGCIISAECTLPSTGAGAPQ